MVYSSTLRAEECIRSCASLSRRASTRGVKVARLGLPGAADPVGVLCASSAIASYTRSARTHSLCLGGAESNDSIFFFEAAVPWPPLPL